MNKFSEIELTQMSSFTKAWIAKEGRECDDEWIEFNDTVDINVCNIDGVLKATAYRVDANGCTRTGDRTPIPLAPKIRPKHYVLREYWQEYYCESHCHCTLCGNSGTINTTGTLTPLGVEVGRLNWCICPNGQILRKMNFPFPPRP
jgi:hypothetical protein